MDEVFKVVTTPSGDGGHVTVFSREDTPDGSFEFVPKITVILDVRRTGPSGPGLPRLTVQAEPNGETVYQA
jgi:hypothetical protein